MVSATRLINQATQQVLHLVSFLILEQILPTDLSHEWEHRQCKHSRVATNRISHKVAWNSCFTGNSLLSLTHYKVNSSASLGNSNLACHHKRQISQHLL